MVFHSWSFPRARQKESPVPEGTLSGPGRDVGYSQDSEAGQLLAHPSGEEMDSCPGQGPGGMEEREEMLLLTASTQTL